MTRNVQEVDFVLNVGHEKIELQEKSSTQKEEREERGLRFDRSVCDLSHYN